MPRKMNKKGGVTDVYNDVLGYIMLIIIFMLFIFVFAVTKGCHETEIQEVRSELDITTQANLMLVNYMQSTMPTDALPDTKTRATASEFASMYKFNSKYKERLEGSSDVFFGEVYGKYCYSFWINNEYISGNNFVEVVGSAEILIPTIDNEVIKAELRIHTDYAENKEACNIPI